MNWWQDVLVDFFHSGAAWFFGAGGVGIVVSAIRTWEKHRNDPTLTAEDVRQDVQLTQTGKITQIEQEVRDYAAELVQQLRDDLSLERRDRQELAERLEKELRDLRAELTLEREARSHSDRIADRARSALHVWYEWANRIYEEWDTLREDKLPPKLPDQRPDLLVG